MDEGVGHRKVTGMEGVGHRKVTGMEGVGHRKVTGMEGVGFMEIKSHTKVPHSWFNRLADIARNAKMSIYNINCTSFTCYI